MRLFIAILFDRAVLDSLTGFQKELRKIGAVGNYTKEDNLHLTLAFIGEYTEYQSVMEAMKQVSFRPFEISIDGMGCFGDILWAGIDADNELTLTVQRLRQALKDAEIPYDRKKFTPHVTLVRKVRYKTDQRIPLERLRQEKMIVKRLSLMKSERGENGMVYTEIGCNQCG